MSDYKTMYAILCGAISDALGELTFDSEKNRKVAMILEQALRQAEELYLSREEV